MITTASALNKLGKREKMLAMADIRPITEEERKIIINNAMNDEKLGDKVLEVLKCIEYLSRNYGVAWPSNIYLSEKLSFSSRSISRYIAVLIATGYVIRNFVYRNGKIFVRTLALNYRKAKEVVKVNIPKWSDIIAGVKISKKQFFTYLNSRKNNQSAGNKSIENNACDGFKNDADNGTENSFWHAVGKQVGVCNIYNLNKPVKVNISSNEDIYARARVASCEKFCEAEPNTKEYKRESYWDLIDRKIPVISSETRQLNELMKQHTKQRMLFRKAPTNYALELTIDKLFNKFKSMKNRIKTVEKTVKNGWINIGDGGTRKIRKMPQKEHKMKPYSTDYESVLNGVSYNNWDVL